MSAFTWRLRRIAAIMRLEAQLLLRDRPTLSLLLLLPVVQMLLFGAAVNLNPRGLALAVAGAAPTIELTRRAAGQSQYFDTVAAHAATGDALQAVQRGAAQIAAEWQPDGTVVLFADGSDPAATRPAAGALAMALSGASAARIHWLYNPDGESSWSVTPGLVGAIVMISMLLLGALTLVREREQGTWEAMLATATDGSDALLGKLVPYLLAGVAQAAIVALAAHHVFGVPMRGSFAALMMAAALLAATHLLLGFALSALAATQLQAIQAAVFFYLPSMLLSGFMFPFSGMPRWAQWLGECLPLTHFVRIARSLMLRGDDAALWRGELLPMAVFAVLACGLALASYRRHLT